MTSAGIPGGQAHVVTPRDATPVEVSPALGVSLTVRGIRWRARPDVVSDRGTPAVGVRFDSEDAGPRFAALTSEEVRLLGDLSSVGTEYFAWLLERARPLAP